MKFQAPPGMRDFYPEDMRLQNWLLDHWRAASRAFGFEEYEGPIFESLELYAVKSGEGIAEQLFHFEDRGGRKFAIRPEMTPTLARLVAARANALPRPIKWFSIPRLCRAERPQRGRLREFMQWNIDILGSDDALADAECVAVAVELFRRVGVTASEVVVRYSSRPLAGAVLASFGLGADRLDAVLALLDKAEKLPPETFAVEWNKAFGAIVEAATIQQFLNSASLDDALAAARKAESFGAAMASGEGAGAAWMDNLHAFQANAAALGIADYLQFDLRIVRGLAYYTGLIFEAFPRTVGLRALLGGGRYDNLTELVGGPRVPGVGFGAGDAPLFEFLRELGKLPATAASLDVFVIDADAAQFPLALDVAMKLRRAGLCTDYSYKRQAIGKQLQQATQRGARYAVIVGAEFAERNVLTIKNLADRTQRELAADQLFSDPRAAMASSE
jgi:histidyl-tRNA synthetase